MSRRPQVYDFKSFVKILKYNGYEFDRRSGDHHIYKNGNGRSISVNFHLNKVVALRLIKEYNLIVNKVI